MLHSLCKTDPAPQTFLVACLNISKKRLSAIQLCLQHVVTVGSEVLSESARVSLSEFAASTGLLMAAFSLYARELATFRESIVLCYLLSSNILQDFVIGGRLVALNDHVVGDLVPFASLATCSPCSF